MQISVINCFSSSNIFSCFFTSFSRPWNQIIEYFTEWIMMITLWRMYWLMDQKLIMPSLSLKSVCCTELIKQDLIWHANPAVYDLAWKQKQDKHYDLVFELWLLFGVKSAGITCPGQAACPAFTDVLTVTALLPPPTADTQLDSAFLQI